MADGPAVAIVTGAARGIGAATAQHLADRGMHVVVVDSDGEALTARWSRRDVSAVVGDVADPGCAQDAVTTATAAGHLRALVNNAGIVADRTFIAQPDEEWAAVQRTVLEGTRAMSRAVAHQMCRDAEVELSAGPEAPASARRIVNTIPAAAATGTPGGSASAAAGGALAGLTVTLARELGGHGIRVNAVLVGYVGTRLTGPLPPTGAGPGLPEPVRQLVAATTALGRFGTPEEVAAVHGFLTSADADYVTGAVIPVTGGLLGT